MSPCSWPSFLPSQSASPETDPPFRCWIQPRGTGPLSVSKTSQKLWPRQPADRWASTGTQPKPPETVTSPLWPLSFHCLPSSFPLLPSFLLFSPFLPENTGMRVKQNCFDASTFTYKQHEFQSPEPQFAQELTGESNASFVGWLWGTSETIRFPTTTTTHTGFQLLCYPLLSFIPHSSLLVFEWCWPSKFGLNKPDFNNPSSLNIFKSSSRSSVMEKYVIIIRVISITYLYLFDLGKVQKCSYYVYLRNRFGEDKVTCLSSSWEREGWNLSQDLLIPGYQEFYNHFCF